MKNAFPATNEGPRPHFGNSFQIDVCCPNGVLEAVECDCIIFHCPDHMTLCIKDGEVLAARTNGIRQ